MEFSHRGYEWDGASKVNKYIHKGADIPCIEVEQVRVTVVLPLYRSSN